MVYKNSGCQKYKSVFWAYYTLFINKCQVKYPFAHLKANRYVQFCLLLPALLLVCKLFYNKLNRQYVVKNIKSTAGSDLLGHENT